MRACPAAVKGVNVCLPDDQLVVGNLDWKQQAPAGSAGLINRAGPAIVLWVDDKRSCMTRPRRHRAQHVVHARAALNYSAYCQALPSQ